ncbi:sensor histidine kinase [Deinococcus roseus]|nr:sensor histidine kinase [Deinococcus roseus]
MWPLVVAGSAGDLQEIAGFPDIQPWRTTLIAPWNSLQELAREVWGGIQGQFAFDRKQRNLQVLRDAQGHTLQDVKGILKASPSHQGAVLLVRADVGATLHGSEELAPGSKVTLSMTCGGAEVELRVQDTGIGIPEEDLEKVFERFYRASHQRLGKDPGGTGLGLAIARTIVDEHGGTIQLESKVGVGTTVVVRLPAQRELS